MRQEDLSVSGRSRIIDGAHCWREFHPALEDDIDRELNIASKWESLYNKQSYEFTDVFTRLLFFKWNPKEDNSPINLEDEQIR